jgi:DNA-binding response OmpR family regulator
LQKSALIVDDDQSVLRNFSRLLRENGYAVQAVETGGEAIALVNKQCFDVVLIDFKLPDIDGAELLQQICEKISSAVKIMITGFPTTDLENRVIDLGIDAYVVKPMKPDELLELIEERIKEKTSCSS